MDEKLIGAALVELSDLANAVSGDFHCLHLNIQGAEFDVMHKDVLKTYYEEAASDYDEFAELARMYDVIFPTPNKSAERIYYDSYNPNSLVSKAEAVQRSKEIMEALQENYLKVFKLLNKIDDCSRAVGIANFLQTRIEYWSKECYYFNKSREVS